MNTLPRHFVTSIALAAVLTASCAGGTAPVANPSSAETQPTAAAPGSADAQADTLPEGLAFKDMTPHQRGMFMQQKVMPAMKPIFQAFDAKEFEKFSCMTCHGPSAQANGFAMPTSEIPRLPVPENFMPFAQDPKNAPWVKFMAEQVTPQMAKLLQKPAYDPATNQGEVSCHSCHMTEGEASPAAKN